MAEISIPVLVTNLCNNSVDLSDMSGIRFTVSYGSSDPNDIKIGRDLVFNSTHSVEITTFDETDEYPEKGIVYDTIGIALDKFNNVSISLEARINNTPLYFASIEAPLSWINCNLGEIKLTTKFTLKID